ncbi:MAG: hypothetical protein ABTQ29_10760 [Siculibacillus sp.]
MFADAPLRTLALATAIALATVVPRALAQGGPIGSAPAESGVSPIPDDEPAPPPPPPPPLAEPGVVGPPWMPLAHSTGMDLLPAPADPVIVRNGADGATHPGVRVPNLFSLDRPYLVTQVMTCHYGVRRRPGTIAFADRTDRIFGPWQAAGAVDQDNVPDAYWWVRPNLRLMPGVYTVIDSDPATWSWENATRGAGIVRPWGRPM